MSALNPKVSLLTKLAEIASQALVLWGADIATALDAESEIRGLLIDPEVREWMDRMAVLEYTKSTLIKGPVEIVYTCSHVEIAKFLESTQEHVDFLAKGPCRACWLESKEKPLQVAHVGPMDRETAAEFAQRALERSSLTSAPEPVFSLPADSMWSTFAEPAALSLEEDD
jgi:hypothetical protein